MATRTNYEPFREIERVYEAAGGLRWAVLSCGHEAPANRLLPSEERIRCRDCPPERDPRVPLAPTQGWT